MRVPFFSIRVDAPREATPPAQVARQSYITLYAEIGYSFQSFERLH